MMLYAKCSFDMEHTKYLIAAAGSTCAGVPWNKLGL